MHTTSAPSPVHLLKKDPKNPEDKGTLVELTFVPLTDRDIDSLDEWLRSDYLMTVRQSFREDPNITDDEKRLELQIAQREASGLTWMQGRGASLMACPKGMARLVWQHLTDKSIVTLEELRVMLHDPDNVNLATDHIEKVNNSGYRENKIKELSGSDSPGKKRRSKRLKKRKKRK